MIGCDFTMHYGVINESLKSMIVIEIFIKYEYKNFGWHFQFSFLFIALKKIAVELQSDKIYHWKAEKISYRTVYLVKLYEFWPVLKKIGVDSTGRRLRSFGVGVSADKFMPRVQQNIIKRC